MTRQVDILDKIDAYIQLTLDRHFWFYLAMRGNLMCHLIAVGDQVPPGDINSKHTNVLPK